MNPANDHNMPYFEIMRDVRGRWSWMMWDEHDDPVLMSAISHDTMREAAEELKEAKKRMRAAPTIIYTERRRVQSGRYTQKSISELSDV